MTETAIIERLESRIDALTRAFSTMAETLSRDHGAMLSRAQVCDYLKVNRSTLARYEQRSDFQRPNKRGKFMLADVVEWEAKR